MKHDYFENQVAQYVREQCRLEPDARVLVALSGGADSVALLRVLLALGYDCVAAHCNFHLRGDESVRDEHFVRTLCQGLGVPLHVRDFDVEGYRSEHHGSSVEMACRELRYAWFRELLDLDKCRCVAVAHHRDDNIETMFLNMLRGTGIAGMVGMKPCHGRVVRPLLCVSRADVEDYLGEIGQDYVTDSTNLTNDYRRNKVRNVLLNAIDSEFPQGRERIADTMANLAQWRELFDELVGDVVESCRVPQCDDEKVVYSLAPLNYYPHPKLLLHVMLSPYGFGMSQCEQIAAVAGDENRSGKAHFYTSTNIVTLTSEQLIVERLSDAQGVVVDVDFENTSVLPVKLEVSRCAMPFDRSAVDGKCAVAFDSKLLSCSHVVLRHWRQGDRMRPYGMKGSRLLSDIFSDAHLTLAEKHRLWLLEADGEIIWVVGMRAGASFAVTERSEWYVRLRYIQ